jgi:hypothetical protein
MGFTDQDTWLVHCVLADKKKPGCLMAAGLGGTLVG